MANPHIEIKERIEKETEEYFLSQEFQDRFSVFVRPGKWNRNDLKRFQRNYGDCESLYHYVANGLVRHSKTLFFVLDKKVKKVAGFICVYHDDCGDVLERIFVKRKYRKGFNMPERKIEFLRPLKDIMEEKKKRRYQYSGPIGISDVLVELVKKNLTIDCYSNAQEVPTEILYRHGFDFLTTSKGYSMVYKIT